MEPSNTENLPEIKQAIVIVIICSGDGPILLGRKHMPEASTEPSLWHLVGGELGADEPPVNAASRYVHIQTGIDLAKLSPATAFEAKDFSFEELEAIELGGSPEALPTGEKRWVVKTVHVVELTLYAEHDKLATAPGGDFSELQWVDPDKYSSSDPKDRPKLDPGAELVMGKTGHLNPEYSVWDALNFLNDRFPSI
jgi:ADP-ribose pyrophosphatase YjhB (NUDIX family)